LRYSGAGCGIRQPPRRQFFSGSGIAAAGNGGIARRVRHSLLAAPGIGHGMSEEILINITPMESRVAVVENGVLQEVHVERTQRRGIVGNIYKGKVVRVLPGMQAAFVDIGLDRAAFIHASEISTREGSAVESISALVHEGQSLVVQVTKDPI